MATLIQNVQFFDGTKNPSFKANILIEDGVIKKISKQAIKTTDAVIINGDGKWLMPGFIDTHTHYDAEVLLSPGLKESVRHGITTAIFGSCSISMVYSDPEDCSDIFTRVEGVPRDVVLPLLKRVKTWKTPAQFKTYLETLALGPNVAAFIGHSDIRISTLGFQKAVDKDYTPSQTELTQMAEKTELAMQAGYCGLSMMTTKWDKLDGERERSKPLPSTFAKLSEFRFLNRILRKYNRVLQGAPDIVTKYNMFFFLWESAGLFKRKLKTTLITLADTKSNPIIYLFAMSMAKLFNTLFNADFRWQALPCKFQVFADGMDLVVFEEFGAGEEALHLADPTHRNQLLADQQYRKRFIKDYQSKFSPRVWHRNFSDAFILACPNPNFVNKSFGQLAKEMAVHPVELFLDTVIEYGTKLRWTTTIANHRRKALERMISSEAAIISFSDAGAHLRNMAFYNFPLQMLKLVYDAQKRGESFMTLEHAVHRLTKELADWFGLNTGYLAEGVKADFVLIDPKGLNDDVLQITEASFPEMNQMQRLVNRNKDVIAAVFIAGVQVFDGKDFCPGYGSTLKTGQFLEAQ